MNKQTYLKNLLGLCTATQKDLFTKMYPTWPTSNQLSAATSQVENTLRNLNTTNEDLKIAKRNARSAAYRLIIQIDSIEEHLRYTEKKLKEANAKIKWLETTPPANANANANTNANTQERLELLNALEAGGVDNWEFYEDSISDYHDAIDSATSA